MKTETATTSARVDALVGPECVHGVLSILIAVPESERMNPAHDIAEAYAVESGHEIPGGCIIWGLYHGRWIANVSGRWLLSRFIRGASLMNLNADCGGNGWWQGCGIVQELARV